MQEQNYTVDEAAEIARVHRSTVLRWIRDGRLEARRVTEHGPWRIAKAELIEKFGGNESE